MGTKEVVELSLTLLYESGKDQGEVDLIGCGGGMERWGGGGRRLE